jgi:outer membrane protein TolC
MNLKAILKANHIFVLLLSIIFSFNIPGAIEKAQALDDTIIVEPDIKNLELNLEEALRLGLIYSPVLKVSHTAIEQARARLAQVRSNYWPKVTARAGYEWMDDHRQTEFSIPAVIRDTLAKSKAYFDLDRELALARSEKAAIESLLVSQGYVINAQQAQAKTDTLDSPQLWGAGDQDINAILASNTTAGPVNSWDQAYTSAKLDIPEKIVEDIRADKAFTVKANVKMPLFTFGRLGHMSRAAEAEVNRKKLEHRRREKEVTLIITRAFYESLYSRAVKDILDDFLAKLLLFHDRLDALSGDETKVRPYYYKSFNSFTEKIKGLLKKSEMLFASRKDHLKAVIGVRDPLVQLRLYGGYREFRLLENFNLKNCISYALKNRLELLETGAMIAKAEEVIKKCRSEYLPQLNIMGQYQYTRSFKEDWSSTIEDQDKSEWLLGIGADINVFDGFERSAVIREYTSKIESLKAQRSNIKQNIKSQVSDAYYDVFAFYERRQSLEGAKNLVNGAVQESLDSFTSSSTADPGTAGLEDVQRLLQQEIETLMDHCTEERNYYAAFADLKRALGYETAETKTKYESSR